MNKHKNKQKHTYVTFFMGKKESPTIEKHRKDALNNSMRPIKKT